METKIPKTPTKRLQSLWSLTRYFVVHVQEGEYVCNLDYLEHCPARVRELWKYPLNLSRGAKLRKLSLDNVRVYPWAHSYADLYLSFIFSLHARWSGSPSHDHHNIISNNLQDFYCTHIVVHTTHAYKKLIRTLGDTLTSYEAKLSSSKVFNRVFAQ